MDVLLHERVERLEIALAILYNCLCGTATLDALGHSQRAVLEEVMTQVSLRAQAMGLPPMPPR